MKSTTRFLFSVAIVFLSINLAVPQSPSPIPADQRGVGIKPSGPTTSTQADQQVKEAKPELVLQTGYNDLFGATRLLFSPDGKLLATATRGSSTIMLWETATTRKLRDLSTGQSSTMFAPVLAFSRDNRFLAAASGDNSVKIWEVVNGREVQSLTGPQGTTTAALGIYFLAFTPDNRLVTISEAARVWDISAGRELRNLGSSSTLMISVNGTGGMVLSPDGSQLTLVTNQVDSEVTMIEIATGKASRRMKVDDKINNLQLSFSTDGHLLAAGTVDNRLKLWDLTSKSSKVLTTTTKDFSLVTFSNDGRLVSLSENYTVRIWETTTARELSALKVPNSGAFGSYGDAFVTFSDDGKRIATGGYDTDTIIWETETAKQISKMTGRTNMAYNVAFSSDGTQLSTGGKTLWDLRTGRGLQRSTATREKTYPIPSPDGRVLALRQPSGTTLPIIQASTGRLLHTLSPTEKAGTVNQVRFNADSSMIAVTYSADFQNNPTSGGITSFALGSQVKIWDVNSGRELRSLASGELPVEANFSNDGKMVVTIGSMGEVVSWDMQSGNKLHVFKSSPMKSITDLSKTTSAPKMPKGMPNIPNMPNMADIAEMMTSALGAMSGGTMGRKITSVTFSPDGRMIATGGVETKSNLDIAAMMSGAMNQQRQKGSKQQDTDLMKDLKVETIGQVLLWDVASGQEIAALKGHGRGVLDVAFSRDGKLIASASSDTTIKIWDVASRREIRTLAGHTANIDSISFSPDGRLIASAADDGSTFLWDANTGDHLLTLISLDDGGEWMVVTPQGLFDGSPLTWNQILWRYNQETFNVAPIEWFFNEFYYPGLLADVFAGKRPKVAQDISKKDRRQPVVKLSVVGDPPATGIASRNVKVKIDIADGPPDKDNPKGSGARDVRLFRNGSLVKVWRGDVLNGQASVSLEQDITVTSGPNRLVAYAFNKDNVKSKDAPLVLTGAASLKRKGVAYIIAVGVNEYANTQYNLKYAVADAESVGKEMRTRQTQMGEFERVEVVTLLNENATKANILAALKRLSGAPAPPSLKVSSLDNLKRVEPEDTVIIYYAGHGTAAAQRFYLIPHDLGYTGDRTKLTEQGLNTILTHSISDEEIEEAVEGIDAGHMLLIIDACNSGQALEAEEKRRGPMNSKGLAQLAYEKGMYILTAAQSFQAALEAAQLGHGLLTYALVEEGLKTAVADDQPKDGVLIAREWLDFATERVPQMQEQKMIEGRGVGVAIAFTEGETGIAEPEKRSVQRPRVFYRREMEANPLVIAKP